MWLITHLLKLFPFPPLDVSITVPSIDRFSKDFGDLGRWQMQISGLTLQLDQAQTVAQNSKVMGCKMRRIRQGNLCKTC